MVTQSYETQSYETQTDEIQTDATADGQSRPVHVWAPMCRDIALALVIAHTERFSDWDSDRVVTVPPHADAWE
jgi:hypothetical protein